MTHAHDCGQVINPDAVKAQIEGNILQTLSRTLHEEVEFDAARVTLGHHESREERHLDNPDRDDDGG